MKLHHHLPFALSAALAATVGLAGCQEAGDDSLATAPPVAEEPAGTLEPDATGTPEIPGDAAGPNDTLGSYEPGLGDDAGPTALDITSVALGSEAGPDDTIAMPQDTFAPDDDIVVAIDTDGAASDAQLAARLVYQDGQVAGEQSETITTTGADTTVVTFDNAESWPAGEYKVEVLVNGTPVETTELTVQ